MIDHDVGEHVQRVIARAQPREPGQALQGTMFRQAFSVSAVHRLSMLVWISTGNASGVPIGAR